MLFQDQSFEIGTKIWAQLGSWPAWPAKVDVLLKSKASLVRVQVLCPKAEGIDEMPPRPGDVFCAFYGDSSYEWLPKTKLKALDADAKSLDKVKSNKALHQALLEALDDK